MSTVGSEFRVLEAAATAEDEALRVHEAASLGVLEAVAGSLFRADGAVKVNIIRPCAGKGRGRHVYEADMLKREAAKFAGWPMFIDHETPEQVKANGGMPPSIWKIGGEILESWWDDSVPSGGRFGQGGVVGWAMPSPWMKPVIEAHPRLVGASVNTFATGVKARRTGRGVENVVEGFAEDGSVDWVTKAGAGGGVDTSVLESVMESWLASDNADADTAAWMREHRPAVVEALIKTPNLPREHGEEDQVDPKDLVEAFVKLDDAQRVTVIEALLETDEATAAIDTAVDERLKAVLPKALEAAGTAIEEAALAKVDERLTVRESQNELLRDAKARLEGNAELQEAFIADAWARLSEHAEFKAVEPGADGKGGKTAREVMEATVDAEAGRVKALQEAVGVKAPTRRRTAIVGNGGGELEQQLQEADEDEGDDWKAMLQEANVSDPAAAFGLKKPEPDKPNEAAA